MPFSGELITAIDWGAVQTTATRVRNVNDLSTLQGLSLSNTSGSWAAVDTHSSVRVGTLGYQDHDIDSGTVPFVNRNYVYNLAFAAQAKYVIFDQPNDLQIRLQDVTNTVTIASLSWPSPPQNGPPNDYTYEWQWARINADIGDLPSGNALLELQYALSNTSTATWHSAVYEQFLWVL